MLAAMELFHQKGFQATGLEEILGLSGVCKSNFYYHFRSKEELGLYVLRQKMQEMLQNVVNPTLGNAGYAPKERLSRFFAEMVHFCEIHGCKRGSMFGNMTLELAGHNEEMRRQVEAYFRTLEETIAAALAEGVAGGALELKGMEPEELASAIVALLEGGILLAKGYKQTAPLLNGLKLLLHFIDGESGGASRESHMERAGGSGYVQGIQK